MSTVIAAGGRSFWRRRVVEPIAGQLKQGITPEKIALTIALGMALGIFPILGSTMLLCALAAAVTYVANCGFSTRPRSFNRVLSV